MWPFGKNHSNTIQPLSTGKYAESGLPYNNEFALLYLQVLGGGELEAKAKHPVVQLPLVRVRTRRRNSFRHFSVTIVRNCRVAKEIRTIELGMGGEEKCSMLYSEGIELRGNDKVITIISASSQIVHRFLPIARQITRIEITIIFISVPVNAPYGAAPQIPRYLS